MAFDELVDVLESYSFDSLADPSTDILKREPGLTMQDAERIQLAVKDRQVEKGDAIIGYKAGFVPNPLARLGQAPAPAEGEPAPPGLSFGTLLRSHLIEPDEFGSIGPGISVVEPEIAVVLKEDLEGPDVTPTRAMAATEGILASLELQPVPPEWNSNTWSFQHLAATNKSAGGVVFSREMISPHGVDMRLEGLLLTIGGELRSAGIGYSQLGDPFRVLAGMANLLAHCGRSMKAGQIVMTGTMVHPRHLMIEQGTGGAMAEFTRLGKLGIRFE